MIVKRIYNFIRYNKQKRLLFLIYFYLGYFRFYMIKIKKDYLEKKIGVRGGESKYDETLENIRLAKVIAYRVNQISTKTPWQSKCLVRALTIQKLLIDRKINCTLYLGVGKNNDNMIAHAWIRCGECYLSGGNGEGYAIVGQYSA